MASRDLLPVLTPGTPVLIRADRRVHVGADPRTALVVDLGPNVTVGAVGNVLQQLRTPQHYRHLRRAVRSSGLTATAFFELLDQLVDHGKAVEPAPRRAPFLLGVAGHGELATMLLGGLACPGTTAAPFDAGNLVGHGGRQPQLVIIADQPVADPAIWQPLMTASVPHLPVFVRDDVGVVGPLVLPGLSSCLHCINLHLTDLDPAWPLLAASLHGIAGASSTATRLATAALAHAHVTEIVEKLATGTVEGPLTLNNLVEFRSYPCSVHTVSAPIHPRCIHCRTDGSAPRHSLSTILKHAAKGHH